MLAAEVQAKIKGYETLIEKAKMEVVKAETQLAQLEAQKTQLIAQLSELGLTEDELPEAIAKLEAEIEDAVKQLDAWAAEVKAVLG